MDLQRQVHCAHSEAAGDRLLRKPAKENCQGSNQMWDSSKVVPLTRGQSFHTQRPEGEDIPIDFKFVQEY